MQQLQRIPTRREVKERIASLISEIADVPRDLIRDGATVDRELRMESVTFVEIMVAIEDEFQIEIDPLFVVELNEFGAIASYVYQCITA